jgi:hypothetical protein
MAKKEAMSDAELLAITGNEIRQSTGYRTGKLSAARQKNLQYYLCRPVGDLAPPEIEGRSAVVDSSVHDTVEWMLPSLIKTFTGGDSVVEFAPQRPDDEDQASQATDYVNYVFYRQNAGFQILNTWFKDALLSKVGILKVMWDETVVEAREEYNGLSEESLQMIADDEEVEIIEHTAKPDEEDAEQRQKSVQQLTQQLQQAMQAAQQGDPQAQQAVQQIQMQLQHIQSMPPVMLHDIACKRTKNTKQVKIFNVPPEEFLINRDAKSIAEARFVAHQVLRTISDLNASGYKDTESLTSDDIQASMSAERIERITFNDETGWQSGANEVPGDPSQKQIWVTECYMKVDADGDGIAEWRRITRAGNKILDNEECDAPPFVSITPIPLPHQFFGLCPADQALEIQKQKTVVMRAIHDNLSLSVNGRYFAVDGQVNLDDLLTSRPGGVVRMKQAGMAGRLDQGNADAAGAYQFLDYIELQKEQRTGLMRNTQGVNADAMNQTATGINITTNRADTRLELIARNFAETGVKDLFKLILKLICQHQDKEAQIHVAGKWIAIDPRAWRNQYDMTINVGLGTGNKDQEVQHLMALVQSQQQAFAMGIVTPENVYEAHNKLSQALGYKQAGLFFSDPNDPKTKQSMPPPPPNPDDAKHQAQAQMQQAQQQHDAQIEQMKQQHEAQKAQFEAQGKQQEVAASMQMEHDKMTMQAQVDQNRQQVEADQQQAKRQGEAELAQYMAQLKAQADEAKLQHDLQITQMKLDADREKWEFDGAIRLQVAQITAQNALDTASLTAQNSAANEVTEDLGGKEAKADPKHDALISGIAALVSQMSKPKTIIRGADGRATGVQ